MTSPPSGGPQFGERPPETDPDVGYRAAVRQRLIAVVLVVLLGGGAVFGYGWYSRVELAHVVGGSEQVVATVTDSVLSSRSAGRYGGVDRQVRLVTVTWDDDGRSRSNTLEEPSDSPLAIGDTVEVSVIPGSDAVSDLGTAGAWLRLLFVIVALVLWLLWVVVAGRQYRGWRMLFVRVSTAPEIRATVQGTRGSVLLGGTARTILIDPRPGAARTLPIRTGITLQRRLSGQQLDAGEQIVIWVCGRTLIRNRPVSPFLIRSQANGSWFVASGTFPRRATL